MVKEEKKEKNKVNEKTFESNLKDLEDLVKELESGNVPLEDDIIKNTEAMELDKDCSEKLNNATAKVNKILASDGELKDFETPEN